MERGGGRDHKGNSKVEDRKAALWLEVVQGGGNTMMTWVVARRRSVGGEGGIMWAP